MSDLTIDELKAKVKKVEVDIESLRMSGNASRKLEILSEYKEYLQDEIRFLENEKKASGVR